MQFLEVYKYFCNKVLKMDVHTLAKRVFSNFFLFFKTFKKYFFYFIFDSLLHPNINTLLVAQFLSYFNPKSKY